MSIFCNNPEDNRRDGREDYEIWGRPDHERYNNHFNSCDEEYTRGYDSARREEEERDNELREQEDREQRERHENAIYQRQMQEQEEEYYYQMGLEQQHEHDAEYEAYMKGQPQPPQIEIQDDLPF